MCCALAVPEPNDLLRYDRPQKAALLYSPLTGRALEISTTAPGIQFYTGGGLDGKLTGKQGAVYHKFGGLALETQVRALLPGIRVSGLGLSEGRRRLQQVRRVGARNTGAGPSPRN
jgi:galactose mutarotase-like enzyme